MPLTISPPPPEGMDIITKSVGHLMGQPDRIAALTNVQKGSLEIAAPHPVYSVALQDVADGLLLSSAKLVSWRYLLLTGSDITASIEISESEQDGQLEFTHLNHGPFVAGTVDTIAFAESLSEVQAHDYELRLLKIPGLYIIALWLHGPSDILVPLAPMPDLVTPNSHYSEEALVATIRQSALDRINQEGNDLPRS